MVINNEVLIQYGTTPSATNGTVTFPIAYTSTNFSIVILAKNGSATRSRTEVALSSIKNTSFKWTRYDASYNYWICVGF